MLRLKTEPKVVGTRRLVKAIEQGQVKLAFVAQDADLFITRQIGDLCEKHHVAVQEVPTMKALGEACQVQVPTAAAGLLKAQ